MAPRAEPAGIDAVPGAPRKSKAPAAQPPASVPEKSLAETLLARKKKR